LTMLFGLAKKNNCNSIRRKEVFFKNNEDLSFQIALKH